MEVQQMFGKKTQPQQTAYGYTSTTPSSFDISSIMELMMMMMVMGMMMSMMKPMMSGFGA